MAAARKTARARSEEYYRLERLAPIFLVDNIDIKVQKGEKQDKELFKVEAKFPDNKSGPITYIIEAGDDSLFR